VKDHATMEGTGILGNPDSAQHLLPDFEPGRKFLLAGQLGRVDKFQGLWAR
jgi:hypothetical protein